MANRKTYSPASHKIKALIFGDSWTWKTTFWWTAKNAVFLSAESWLLSLRNRGDVPMYDIKSLNDLKSALLDLQQEIKAWTCPFDTVVIDSITEINDIIKMEIEKSLDGWSMTFKQRGEVASTIQWILRAFRDLPLHVLFIAHEKSEKDDDKLLKYKPNLNWKAADSICYYMDIVWYTYIDKNEESIEFKLVVEPKTFAPTKCRGWYITDKTPADFEVWKKIIQAKVPETKNEVEENKDEESDNSPVKILEGLWIDPSFEPALKAVKTIMDSEKDDVQKNIEILKKQIDVSKKLDEVEKLLMNKLADHLLTIC